VKTLSRREWLGQALAILGGSAASGCTAGRALSRERAVQTVTGPVVSGSLGMTLMHEHVLVDFIGADKVSASRYDAEEVFRVALPHLLQARKLGCETLVECTPAYLGRDPRLLRRLSEASGVRILTNTGYYGAAQDKHLPKQAFDESPEQLAARWTAEWERGIDGTGIRPAFMKIGVDNAPLSEVDEKLVRAAAITHRATGLPIASHTTTGRAATQTLDILEATGVPLSSFIWVHAHAERDESYHRRVSGREAWVEFDGLSETSAERHLELLQAMKRAGHLERVLLSHDAGWYRVGEPGGGTFRPYDTLFTTFIPAMKAAGFSDAEVRQVLVENPRRALANAQKS
jgi:phosphotriesterase-related protein